MAELLEVEQRVLRGRRHRVELPATGRPAKKKVSAAIPLPSKTWWRTVEAVRW